MSFLSMSGSWQKKSLNGLTNGEIFPTTRHLERFFEMSYLVKVFIAKSDDLSSILWTYLMERKNQSCKVSSDLNTGHGMPSHNKCINKCFSNE